MKADEKLRKRKLIYRLNLCGVKRVQVHGDVLRFVVLVWSGDRFGSNAPVRFEFHNARYAKQYNSGHKDFPCHNKQNPELAMVAQLTDRIEEVGGWSEFLRMPVFTVNVIADLHGTYEADSGK